MDLKHLINKLDTIASKQVLLESEIPIIEGEETWSQRAIDEHKEDSSIASKLIESFGYIAEASPEELIRQQPAMSYAGNRLAGADAGGSNANPTGYDPSKTQYAWQDGKANPDWPGNKPPEDQKDKPADDKKPDQPKKKPGIAANPGTKAYQHWLNQNGYKVAIDGKYGPETKKVTSDIVDNRLMKATAEKAKTGKYPPGEEEFMRAWQDMHGVGSAYNVKPGQGPGTISLGDAAFVKIMQQYKYDPKTGNPMPGAVKSAPAAADGKAGAADAKSGQGTQPSGSAGSAGGAVPKELEGAPKTEPYWVNGVRYEWKSTGQRNPNVPYYSELYNWQPTFKPGQWGLNSNQAAAKGGYTGPDSKKSEQYGWRADGQKLATNEPPKQGTQIASANTGTINKESIDDIRFLSGLK